tara:strand:- start:10 stop:351 length:342 start_codon:yes stop_codon:yes gene_type:complete
MMISNCCGATFPEPGHPDTDLCGACYEHCDAVDSEDWNKDMEDTKNVLNEYNFTEYRNDVIMKRTKQYGNLHNAVFEMDAKIADMEIQIKGMGEYIDILHEKDIKNKKEDTEV